MEEAIGYLRQSTLKQQSLSAQKQTIKALAEKHNIQHITFYSDKQSGRTDKRNGYQQITELIQQGQCDVLCCYRLNRLHRNLKNALKLMKLCQKYHVHILSVHDGYFDMDKAFDRLKLNIFISLAELESDNIGEQVSNGIKEKARQGKLITTHAPFGYHYHNGTFTIDTVKAPTIKAVFNYYLQGYGYKKIAQYLEADNKFINRKPYQVRNIILNPNYCGRVINQYGQYENMFPAIVSTTIYEKAQVTRTQKQVKRKPSENQLKQKIKCPCCGATLTNMTIRRKQHNTLRYYVCPRNMNESRFVCDFKGINAKDIETSVLKTCQHFFQDQQVYSKINDAIQQHIQKQNTLETKRTYTQAQLINKLAKGTIDAETFKTEIQTLHQQNTLTSINSKRIQSAFHNVIQKRFTLNMLYPFIDVIHITKNKELSGIYLKDEPLNIVNQAVQSSIA
ncbi:recombinase family protein [Staphylococcus haemolyticus]|uniref:cassette chromosome recombinase CcrA n=1 Tax=Staphylococcus TaxID=1279 RepID=UPI0018DDD62F|nr:MULTISPECIES: recombinase family protein [Staphylococcus]HDF1236150.1 recombinase family protein [Staphylococcus aureus]MBM0843859.1 recombinase family protein [Staphylococcus saprophyticus]MDT0738728.1 recombinase family protein [Staphylococcus haemolyticus]QPW17813.1 recombinase family protein [Staphylococcus saprophyticus]UNP85195.1 recombinase family protein [Staphylococcus equorum]